MLRSVRAPLACAFLLCLVADAPLTTAMPEAPPTPPRGARQGTYLRGSTHLALGAEDLRPAAGLPAVFELEDPRGNRVHHVEARTSEFGIAAADLPLAEGILVGPYRARATVGAAHAEAVLTVDRYRPPRFKL